MGLFPFAEFRSKALKTPNKEPLYHKFFLNYCIFSQLMIFAYWWIAISGGLLFFSMAIDHDYKTHFNDDNSEFCATFTQNKSIK